MPLMQAAYDKLPDCKVMFSSVDDFPYSLFDPKPIPADETFSYDIRQKMKEVYRQVQDLRLYQWLHLDSHIMIVGQYDIVILRDDHSTQILG